MAKSLYQTALDAVTSTQMKTNIPAFKAGDKVVVNALIKEGEKERVQAYEGIVVSRQGRAVNETFTVRKISGGVGVERTFPLHSPVIQSIENKMSGFVRRAKLYYLRGLQGKKAKIRDRNLKLIEAAGGIQNLESKATKAKKTTESKA